MSPLRGVIFDKDGTLFDFQATWGAWVKGVITAESSSVEMQSELAKALRYNLESERFTEGSIVVAASVSQIAATIVQVTGARDTDALIERLNTRAARAPQSPVCDLADLFDSLKRRGIAIGVVTNDAEAPARAHLDGQGILGDLTFLAGYDSGYTPKPDPAALLGFCAATGLAPEACAMVGDSTHDLAAGRAAGMTCIGVLTGPAQANALAPLADTVLPSIADLPAFLDEKAQA